MDNQVLEIGRRLGGYLQRRASLLDPLCDATGVQLDEIDESHDWNSIPLARFFQGPPFTYYFEPAMVEYYQFLRTAYEARVGDLPVDLNDCGYDIWEAVTRVERLLSLTNSIDLGEYDDFQKVANYLNPWYLELVEQVFDSLLALPAYRLQQEAGKAFTKSIHGIHEAVRSRGWTTSDYYYSSTMRNGIAHEVNFEADQMSRVFKAIYIDAKGNKETLSLDDVEDQVFGLLDVCLGYTMALRLFLFMHRDASGLVQLSKPSTIPFDGRVGPFLELVKLPYFEVLSVHRETVNNQVQIRVECEDRTNHDAERMMGITSALAAASYWFPEAETFFIGMTGQRRWTSGARVSAQDLCAWVHSEISDQNFFNLFDGAVLWPLKKFAGRVRSIARHALAAGLSEARRQWHHAKGQNLDYDILSIDDNSIAIARRYRSEVITCCTKQEDIVLSLPHIVEDVRKRKIYRNDVVKKRWGRTSAHYVDGFIYSREKRRRDRWADISSEYYVGRFEWRDLNTDQTNLPIPLAGSGVIDLGGGLVYEPNPNWPYANIRLPYGAAR